MSTTVTLKRSSVQGKAPQPSDLDYGEVALNFTDGRLYFRDSADEVKFFDANARGDAQSGPLDEDTDLGLITDTNISDTLNLGLVTDGETSSIDLGFTPATSGFVSPDIFVLPNHDSSSLPSTTPEYQLIYLSDQDTLAFSDGNNWNQFASVATSGSYNDLSDTPNLATIATTGDYDDLTNKPPQGASTGKAIAMAIVFG